jgi:lipoprotein-anchoring transpeptidase ErfK/SrfK
MVGCAGHFHARFIFDPAAWISIRPRMRTADSKRTETFLVKLVRNLLGATLIVSGIGWTGGQASAAIGIAPAAGNPVAADTGSRPPLQLAQSGDVEIYYDEYGRRVIVDAFTGEVLGIERPRRTPAERRALRRRELYRDPQFGTIVPEDDIPYRPRPYVRGRPVEEYPEYPLRPSPEAPEYAYPDAPEQVFPDAPDDAPIERNPLDSALADPGAGLGTGAMRDAPAGDDTFANEPAIKFGAREDVAALQILLDRKGASSGVIDGRFGSNLDKALIAYRDITGENLHSTDAAKIKADLAASGGEAFISYTITAEDAAGPFVASVPADYGAKAKLERLGFTSASELLAERFHMDEAYLKALNPGAVFGRPGTVIKVANIGQNATTPVARIVADKNRKQVRAYDDAGKLVVAYPATIGSADTPSPSGTHAVERVAFDPDYTYNPNLNFKQGDNSKILKIPPGPNGPVGSIWIALDKPTYGIHGTPDPSKIGKTESHGCVRLTNWDAAELAKLVKPGVPVEFYD